jgi:limonene-1,2-epoxide hydrolase
MEILTELEPQTLEPLTTERIRELWSKTYNLEGKPDWSHIFPYYADQVVFQDSIQRVEGIADFKAMCARLTKRCQQLNMEIDSIVKEGNVAFLQWKMIMRFNKYPSTVMFGCTKLSLGKDGKIIHQRDYFDMWGDIFNNIPYFKKPYRRFLHKHFG